MDAKLGSFFCFAKYFGLNLFIFFVWVVVRRWEKVVCRRDGSGGLGREVIVVDERA